MTCLNGAVWRSAQLSLQPPRGARGCAIAMGPSKHHGLAHCAPPSSVGPPAQAVTQGITGIVEKVQQFLVYFEKKFHAAYDQDKDAFMRWAGGRAGWRAGGRANFYELAQVGPEAGPYPARQGSVENAVGLLNSGQVSLAHCSQLCCLHLPASQPPATPTPGATSARASLCPLSRRTLRVTAT